jgi:hypothetical protein
MGGWFGQLEELYLFLRIVKRQALTLLPSTYQKLIILVLFEKMT